MEVGPSAPPMFEIAAAAFPLNPKKIAKKYALVPIIQTPIMKLLTTEEERKIKMEQLRPVSKTEKILFQSLSQSLSA